MLSNLNEGMHSISSSILQNIFNLFSKEIESSFSRFCINFCKVSIEHPLAPCWLSSNATTIKRFSKIVTPAVKGTL